jgi:hypothetical protein
MAKSRDRRDERQLNTVLLLMTFTVPGFALLPQLHLVAASFSVSELAPHLRSIHK